MNGNDGLLRNSINRSELGALRGALQQALVRLTEALVDDLVDFDELDSLRSEYDSAYKSYMEAMGWDLDVT